METSIYVHGDYRRLGVGRALYTALFRVLTAQGYVHACAGITLPNPGSVGLHEAMGFRPVGVYRKVGYKFGRWHDVGWWQRTLRQAVDQPRPPIPLAALREDPTWTGLLQEGQPIPLGWAAPAGRGREQDGHTHDARDTPR